MTAPRTSTPPRFDLLWREDQHDPQLVKNVPRCFDKADGHRYLSQCYEAAKSAGYTVQTLNADGMFVARKGGHVTVVWMQEMTVSAVEWQEEQSA